MCNICQSWKENKLTIVEAVSNMMEMRDEIGNEHFNEIIEMLEKSHQKDEEESPSII